MFWYRVPILLIVVSLLVCAGGCQRARYEIAEVHGTVKFSDGTVPQGGIVRIRFLPKATYSADAVTAPAIGEVNPDDGTFELTTFKHGDGAILGEYSVAIEVVKHYAGPPRQQQRPLPEIADKYRNSATNPLAAEVRPGDNSFDFVLDKKQ